MNDLEQTHVVNFLEAAYALEHDDDEWLTRCLYALSVLCGSEYNYSGFLYDASNVESLEVRNLCALQAFPPELQGVWSILASIATPDFVRSTFRSLFLGSASKTKHLKPLLQLREQNGHGDVLCLNGLDPSGVGCLFSIGSRQKEFVLDAGQAALLRRVVSHLSAAYRFRRKLAAAEARNHTDAQAPAEVTTGAEAILDTVGRVVHAEGAAKGEVARERLKRGAAAMDAARTKRRRGAEAIEGWHPLIAARWTLVDTFEEDGRRYIVARENRANPQGLEVFTDRERQVVVHAAFGLTNKEIAYTLGISHTTVRVLMARAAKRAHVGSREALLAHPLLRDLRPPVETRH